MQQFYEQDINIGVRAPVKPVWCFSSSRNTSRRSRTLFQMLYFPPKAASGKLGNTIVSRHDDILYPKLNLMVLN